MPKDELAVVEAIPSTKLFINNTVITEQDALDTIESVINRLHKTKDLNTVDIAIDTLIGLQHISGKALAKLLWGTRQWWNKTKQEDVFEDYLQSRHGLRPITIQRYTLVWEKMQSDLIPAKVQTRVIRDLIPIAIALDNGYEFSKNTWRKLEFANNNAEVLTILREDVRKKPPRKSSMRIYMERDGTLNVWKDNKMSYVGYLDINNEDENTKKSISRILTNAGIITK
jgi:hypothetical protein